MLQAMDDDRVFTPEILELPHAFDDRLATMQEQLQLELTSLAACIARSTTVRHCYQFVTFRAKRIPEETHLAEDVLQGRRLQRNFRVHERGVSFQLAQLQRVL